METNHTNERAASGLSSRSTMVTLISINAGISIFLVLAYIISYFMAGTVVETFMGAFWQLFIFPIMLVLAIGVIMLLVKLIKKKWTLIFPFSVSLLTSVALLFTLPYLS